MPVRADYKRSNEQEVRKTARTKSIETQAQLAVIYARYSSHAQNDASIEQQVEKCQEYAQRLGIQITAVYSDRALTGKSDRRPEFQKMMRDAGNGKFQCVIAWKSNRMGRNMLEAMLNDAKLSDHGIRCLYVEEDFGDSAAGRFALRNMMNVNQFYSENMAEDIRRGMMDNATKCKVNGMVPFGYRRGEDGCYVIDEARAEIVREIFRRIADGDSFAALADDLNARAIRTSLGRPWGKNSFHAIMANERYLGTYIYSDIRIENGIPQIIDRKTFEIVKEKLGRRKEVAGRRRENDEYLLTGKLFCGKCGAPMAGYSGTSHTGAIHNYYYCRNRRSGGTCDKNNVRRDAAEALVANSIKQYILQENVVEWLADSVLEFQDQLKGQSKLGYYQDKLVETKKAIDNIMKAIEAGIFSTTVSSRLQKLESDQHEFQSRIEYERASVPTVTRDQIIYWLKSFRNGDVNDRNFQKQLFENFLVAAYLYDDKLKIVFNYTEDKNTIEIPISIDSLCSQEENGSFNPSAGPPLTAETNPVSIRMFGTMFVLTVYLD